MSEKSFVYGDVEVKLTGRKAAKYKAAASRNAGQVSSIVYEITPKDIEDGSWKKWVKSDELYEIVQDQQEPQ